MRLELHGLEPESIHGWHLHTAQIDENGDCAKAEGHFNPFGAVHGAPDSDERHVGDFGNFQADKHGNVRLNQYDELAVFFK